MGEGRAMKGFFKDGLGFEADGSERYFENAVESLSGHQNVVNGAAGAWEGPGNRC